MLAEALYLPAWQWELVLCGEQHVASSSHTAFCSCPSCNARLPCSSRVEELLVGMVLHYLLPDTCHAAYAFVKQVLSRPVCDQSSARCSCAGERISSALRHKLSLKG